MSHNICLFASGGWENLKSDDGVVSFQKVSSYRKMYVYRGEDMYLIFWVNLISHQMMFARNLIWLDKKNFFLSLVLQWNIQFHLERKVCMCLGIAGCIVKIGVFAEFYSQILTKKFELETKYSVFLMFLRTEEQNRMFLTEGPTQNMIAYI